jgi:rhodanese-related sulfurtransferase
MPVLTVAAALKGKRIHLKGMPMPSSVKELLAAANAAVTKISAAEAKRLVAEKDALVLDVRDAPEVETSGKVPGALHVSRGMLEFRADPESPYHNAAFTKDRPVIVYCASGGRSALAGKVLKDFGYAEVFNLGGFKDWVEQGGEVEPIVDTGM